MRKKNSKKKIRDTLHPFSLLVGREKKEKKERKRGRRQERERNIFLLQITEGQ